jgi:hypothetical protein
VEVFPPQFVQYDELPFLWFKISLPPPDMWLITASAYTLTPAALHVLIRLLNYSRVPCLPVRL